METAQYYKNLEVPAKPIDVVLDTDAYNEVDDQFAISYLLKSPEKLRTKAIYAAPFFNERSSSPEDGMEKSYEEIKKILALGHFDLAPSAVFRGSARYLEKETVPVMSAAAQDLAERAMQYTAEAPLYVVAIGAITNIASAMLLRPEIYERIVVVWLGGHALHYRDTREFNMQQDVAAARVVFSSGVPLVQLPCMGVVDSFAVSGPELRYWLGGKNPLCDYLTDTVISAAEAYAKGRVWSRVLWDVTAVGWLLNEENRFMSSHLVHCPVPEYDHRYSIDKERRLIRYVDGIHRDALMEDLFSKLTRERA